MLTSAAAPRNAYTDFGFSALVGLGKRVLNGFAEHAAEAAERSRFAALPRRYLDDVGMTPGERAAVLHFEEPVADVWTAVAAYGD